MKRQERGVNRIKRGEGKGDREEKTTTKAPVGLVKQQTHFVGELFCKGVGSVVLPNRSNMQFIRSVHAVLFLNL